MVNTLLTLSKTAPRAPASNALSIEMYETMLLARALDERMWILNRQGRAPFVISCQGHEAAQTGVAFALEPGRDVVFPYYRDVGVVLRFGLTAREIMLGFLAKAADPSSGGRQMPNHFGSTRRRIMSVSSPVATQIPQAAGAALAAKIRRDDSVVAVFFGEGCTSSGAFHEGLNFASIHRLPVLLVCENNGWAISVPREKQMAVPTVAERAAAYGMPGVCVGGTDPLAVHAAAREAVERARTGLGPTLLDLRVHRLTAHSSDDDDRRYRSPDDVEIGRQRDPLVLYGRTLRERGVISEAQDEDLHQQAAAVVEDALVFAEASPDPDPATLTEHVYA
jgi:2-oxoisovalerate dehydrogenase E1 component alpha subunit